MLIAAAAFILAFALAAGASRLRSVAGLMGLVAAAYAGTAADPRAAAMAVVLPSVLALLAADALRVRRRPAARLAAHDRRRAGELHGERHAGSPLRARQRRAPDSASP